MKTHFRLAAGLFAAMSISSTGASTCAHAQSASSTSHPSLPALRVPDALGTNIHFTQEKPGEAKMMASGGFRVIRMDMTWSGIEREKGVYNFDAYDRLTKTLEDNGLKPYYILDYGNPLYSPSSEGHPFTEEADTPAFRAAFAKWAAAAVSRFKGRGIIWEIWNEPNHAGFWKPKPDAAAYTRLALEACRAIRAVAPRECIIGPATSTIDLPFLEACFQAGLLDYWDAVSVHPYRQVAPETSLPEYRDLRRLIEKHKPRSKAMPVLAGEWGYSAAWNNFDEDRQGKYLPRQWLVNLHNRVPVSIWYDWHDDGTDPKEPEHHFGTVRHALIPNRATPYDPKPAYTAAQTLYRQLDGFSFNKRLWTERDDEWVLLFSRGTGAATQVKIAAWTSAPPPTGAKDAAGRTISLPASGGAYAVVDSMGAAKTDISATRNTLLFSISDRVSYITPRGASALWQRAAAWPTVPLESWVQAPIESMEREATPTGIVTGATRRDGEVTAPLLRDSEAQRVVTRHKDGFAQTSDLVVANPLQVQAEAGESTGSLRVRLKSAVQSAAPGAQPESGTVRVALGKSKPVSVPYSIAAGQAEVLVDIPGALGADGRAEISVLDSRGRAQVRARRLRFVPLDSFARAGAASEYGATADGDGAVTSTQAVSQEEAPAPLGGQTVRALKLSYEVGAGWKFVRVLPPSTLKIEGHPTALQVWMHGDGSGDVLRLRVRDETGQTFQPNATPGSVNWKGWKKVSFPLDGKNGSHWGGANDGVMHGALAWDSLFLLDSANKTAHSGALYFANPVLVYENK
jgi:hypothetical protein